MRSRFRNSSPRRVHRVSYPRLSVRQDVERYIHKLLFLDGVVRQFEVFAMVISRSSLHPSLHRKTLASDSLDHSFDFGDLGMVRNYPSRSELFQQGTPADDVYFIREGMVKLVWG